MFFLLARMILIACCGCWPSPSVLLIQFSSRPFPPCFSQDSWEWFLCGCINTTSTNVVVLPIPCHNSCFAELTCLCCEFCGFGFLLKLKNKRLPSLLASMHGFYHCGWKPACISSFYSALPFVEAENEFSLLPLVFRVQCVFDWEFLYNFASSHIRLKVLGLHCTSQGKLSYRPFFCTVEVHGLFIEWVFSCGQVFDGWHWTFRKVWESLLSFPSSVAFIRKLLRNLQNLKNPTDILMHSCYV